MIRPAMLPAFLILASCAPQKEAKETDVYRTSFSLADVMGHVISPSAFQFWGAWGTITDEKGVRDLRPTTEEGWQNAENGAATVAEAANLLLLPERRVDDGEWVKYAHALSAAALEALAATEARDSDRMGEAGSKLDEACEACHTKYLAPNSPGRNRR